MTLFEPGDRVKFRQIDAETYSEISEAVEAGAYRFNIVDTELFSLSRYQAWSQSVLAAEGTANLPW